MRGAKQNVRISLLPPKVQSLYMHWSEAKREDLLASTEGNTVICHCLSPLPNRVWHGLLVYIYKRELCVCVSVCLSVTQLF